MRDYSSPLTSLISIHALLAESDVNDTITNQLCHISIHALLAESDWTARQWISPVGNFYPRSPCGERHLATYSSADSCTDFYPRSPCGERRYNSGLRAYFHHISIHALLAESDIGNVDVPTWIYGFLSTLSLRRATPWFTPHFRADGFLSTLSLRRATPRHFIMFFIQHISIHALLAESDPSNFASLR